MSIAKEQLLQIITEINLSSVVLHIFEGAL